MQPAAFAKTIAESFTTTDVWQSRRQREREAEHFSRVRNAYYAYAVKLRRIARHVGDIIAAFPPGDPNATTEIQRYLQQYAYILRPWARQAGALMIAEVSRRDETAWFRHARMIGRELKREILRATPIGEEVKRILDEQVELITSIPTEAAERVQQISREYWTGGRRYDEMVNMIMNSGNVTLSRATLIARTETAKTSAAVTQARANFVGSTHYIWRTVRDVDVRKAHKKLEGQVCSWDDPPVAEENGTRHHPGNFPNCRPSCYAEPILPAIIE